MVAAIDLSVDVPSEDLVRSKRKPPVARQRARTQSAKRLSKRDLAAGAALYGPEINAACPMPGTRAECERVHLGTPGNPCPYVSCKHHLHLDVNARTGSIKENFGDREVGQTPETCALHVAARGGITLEEVGAIMNLTRERIRQLESRMLNKLRAECDRQGITFADLMDRERTAGIAPEKRATGFRHARMPVRPAVTWAAMFITAATRGETLPELPVDARRQALAAASVRRIARTQGHPPTLAQVCGMLGIAGLVEVAT